VQVKSVTDSSPAPAWRESHLRYLWNRFTNRPDTEHEIVINRTALSLLSVTYAVTVSHFELFDNIDSITTYLWLFAAFNVCSLAIIVHILWKPGVSPIRRLCGMVLDISILVYTMHWGNEAFLFNYPFLLWAIFGNGFRFGTKYLFAASGFSVFLFALLMQFNPFWHRYPALSIGCVIGLIVLPAYVSVLIRKLSDAIAAAEQASQAKSLFLASVSHELRTPLNAIIGLGDLLGASRLNAEQSEMVRTISDSGRSLLSLINSVLDLSRLEVGKMPMVREEIDLHSLLFRVSRMAGVIAEKKGIRLALQIAPDVPKFVLASERQLEEIITNLCSNAIKFTEKGYVFVRVACTGASDEDGDVRLVFDVKDTGIGIAEKALGTIFERFMQADETIVDRFGGTGLGLAIVKQMVEQNGGSIEVTSMVGRGSTFSIKMSFAVIDKKEIPSGSKAEVMLLSRSSDLAESFRPLLPEAVHYPGIADLVAALERIDRAGQVQPVVFYDLASCNDLPAAANLLAGAPCRKPLARFVALKDPELPLDDEAGRYFLSVVETPVSAGSLHKAHAIAAAYGSSDSTADMFNASTSGYILVADDNKTNQMVIGKILEKAGHRAAFADNGEVAVQMLEEDAFDLAFMDLNMPVRNGYEAARLYGVTSLGRKQTPIYALTADVTDEAKRKSADAGMRGCLSKPIEPEKLLRLVDEIIVAAGGSVLAAGASGQASEAAGDREQAGDDAERNDEPIDAVALRDLEELGGPDFVRDIVDQFLEESVCVLKGLADAVDTQDYRAFRDDLHALRSGAANVGARAVFQSCLKWREIDPDELSAQGKAYLLDLQSQIDVARQRLEEHLRSAQARQDASASGVRSA
jgi:two-component system sensor histidine kinase RpfC